MRTGLSVIAGFLAACLLGARQPATALNALDVAWVKMAREREELNGACVPYLFNGRADGCGWTEPTKTKEQVLRERDGGR